MLHPGKITRHYPALDQICGKNSAFFVANSSSLRMPSALFAWMEGLGSFEPRSVAKPIEVFTFS